MFAGFSPCTQCVRADNICPGAISTAPKAMAPTITSSSAAVSTRKKMLLLFFICRMQQVKQLHDILARPWPEIHQVMFFKAVNAVVLSCIGKRNTRNRFKILHCTTHLVKSKIGSDDHVGIG